jgi:hypothetical protein
LLGGWIDFHVQLMKRTACQSLRRGLPASAEPGVAAGVVGFLLVLALGWGFFGSTIRARWFPPAPPHPPSPLVVATPIQTVTFSDGSALTISAVADSVIECGTMNGATGGGMSIGYGDLGLHTWKDKGLPVYQKFTGPACLLLACRLLDASGMALRPYWFQVGGFLHSAAGHQEKFPGWQALAEPGAAAVKLPDVMVQLADGAGGWIDGSGPACAPNDRENRCVLAFAAWPRSAAELEFRAIRPGLQPVVCKMKNPMRSVTPAAWTPDALPKIHTDPEFDLEFLGATTPPDQPNTVQPRFRCTSKVPGDSERKGYAISYQCACVELLGALGTRSKPDLFPAQADPPPAIFHLPPDETMLRFRFTVTPSYFFPYRRAEAILLAKGRVSADGKSIALDPALKSGARGHFANFEEVAFSSAGNGSFKLKQHFAWKNPAELGPAGAALKIPSPWPVCFIGDDETSSGLAQLGGGSSYSGRQSYVDMDVTWSGGLQPGDEITVGVTVPKQPREVIFTTPRPGR